MTMDLDHRPYDFIYRFTKVPIPEILGYKEYL